MQYATYTGDWTTTFEIAFSSSSGTNHDITNGYSFCLTSVSDTYICLLLSFICYTVVREQVQANRLGATRKEAKPAAKTKIQSQTTKSVVTLAKPNITVPKDVVSAVKKITIKSKMTRNLRSFSVDLTHHSVALPSINDGLFSCSIHYRTHDRRSGCEEKQNFKDHFKIGELCLNSFPSR